MILVRLFLFLSLAVILVSGVFYLVKRDRRYLRFIAQVVKYAIIMLLIILVFYAFERLLLVV